MALDPRFVGRRYPPGAPYEVSREKIREFADAVGDPHPAYRDPAAARALGHPDVVAPPTFATLLTLRASRDLIEDPELGLDYSRVVHGEQRFVHVRPIRPGDRLVVTLTVEGIRSAAGNDILTTRADLATTEGEAVCTAWSTLVARGTAPGAAQ
ncbi:MAG: FAS1-like dehydratase domain-containing protein [Actinomycetota bacterium]